MSWDRQDNIKQRLEGSVDCSINSIFKMWLINAGFLEPVETGRDMACGEKPAGLDPRCHPSGPGFTGVFSVYWWFYWVPLVWEQDDFSWMGNDGHKELRGKEEGRGNSRKRGRSNFHSDRPTPCCSPVVIPLMVGFIPTAALQPLNPFRWAQQQRNNSR